MAASTMRKWAMAALAWCLLAEGAAAQSTTTVTTVQATGAIKSITIDGTSYSTAAAALDALRLANAGYLDQLKREAEPLHGRALIVVPDHDRLRPLVAQQAQIALKKPVLGEQLDFYIDQNRQTIHQLADALVRAQAFDAATIVEQNDTRNPDIGSADYLVWFQVRTVNPDNTGAWLGRWQVRRAGGTATGGAAVDPGVAPGTPRYASFVKSVRDSALRLGGATVAAGAGAQPASDKNRRTVSTGSGIVIDTAGHVLTNNHVVSACAEYRVIDAANEAAPATLVAHDGTNDLAVLKSTHASPVAASFRDTRNLRPGDKVVVTGYPLAGVLGSNMSVTTGSLTSLVGPRDDSRLLQLSAPIQPGNSGGPLLDERGAVIGVVTSTLNGTILAVATGVIPQNVNFALKSAVVRSFLESSNIAYATASARGELSPADIAELARKFTVRVECRQ